MKSGRHILILIPGFPKDESDFQSIPPFQDFLLGFIHKHPDVKFSVITFQYPYNKDKYNWNGISVYPLSGKNQIIRKPLVWLDAIKNASRLNREERVISIHSLWLGECALIGKYLSKRFNCQHICTLMGQDVKFSNKYLNWLKKSQTKFVALSQNQSKEFFTLTNRKTERIIHWGINDQKSIDSERDIDLLAVGSLIPLKNYILFIQLIAEISKRQPNLKCKLVGSGPQLSELRSLSDRLNISDNIKFTGVLSRTEIFKLMQRSKIFVHTSIFEGAGYVFAEALVNGMNIVSFDVGYAHRHPKWNIANDQAEFIKITEDLLSSNLDFNPVNTFPLSETISKYASLYGIV